MIKGAKNKAQKKTKKVNHGLSASEQRKQMLDRRYIKPRGM